jgi:ferrous iron transport protein A
LILRLDQLAKGQAALISAIDGNRLGGAGEQRLRALGFDEGVSVELLHHGPIGSDPLACRVGRMLVAIRRSQAAAVQVVMQ